MNFLCANKTEEMFLALVIKGSLDSVTICCPPLESQIWVVLDEKDNLSSSLGKAFQGHIKEDLKVL